MKLTYCINAWDVAYRYVLSSCAIYRVLYEAANEAIDKEHAG
jgi:hypothetical protein